MGTETQVEQNRRIKKTIREPGKFAVIMHNDDVTPMEFVMSVLETVFHHQEKKAEELTMAIHEQGRAVVGVYTLEVAEQKAGETVHLARNGGYPLALTVEPE